MNFVNSAAQYFCITNQSTSTVISDFAFWLILGDLGADSGGKGKSSWQSGTIDHAKFEGGGGGGANKVH